jgi:hemoglobin
VLGGCANRQVEDKGFFTSGSKEADQRAEQKIAKTQQLRGESSAVAGAEQQKEKKTLYEKLGGEKGVNAIIDDFIPRALADPRVNWERKGVKQGGFSIHRGKSVEWQANDQNVANLKKHLAQFFALATGGPSTYEGRDMKDVHSNMHITNAEFDAAIGDLKASLDKLQIPNQDQKELLAIIESTRPQVVAERSD